MGVSINLQLSKLSQNAQRKGESDRVTAQHGLNPPVINTCLGLPPVLLYHSFFNLQPLLLQARTRHRRDMAPIPA